MYLIVPCEKTYPTVTSDNLSEASFWIAESFFLRDSHVATIVFVSMLIRLIFISVSPSLGFQPIPNDAHQFVVVIMEFAAGDGFLRRVGVIVFGFVAAVIYIQIAPTQLFEPNGVLVQSRHVICLLSSV